MPDPQTGCNSPATANPSARDGTNAWSETIWAADGMLVGGVCRVSLVHDLPGTSNSIAARGHRTGVAGLFCFKFGAFEARTRCWRGRCGRPDVRTAPQPSLLAAARATQVARNSGARAPHYQPAVLR